MLSRVIAKNVEDVFFETQCRSIPYKAHNRCLGSYFLHHRVLFAVRQQAGLLSFSKMQNEMVELHIIDMEWG